MPGKDLATPRAWAMSAVSWVVWASSPCNRRNGGLSDRLRASLMVQPPRHPPPGTTVLGSW